MAMMDFDTAQHTLAKAGQPLAASEQCPLHLANGRVLAQTLFAAVNLPAASNSGMDGYAIRHADYLPGVALPIQQRCFAGEQPAPLQPGKATRLFTGSLMPEGADTVIMQENTQETDGHVQILYAPVLGDHVRHAGEDVTHGDQLLAMGTLLGPAQIALLAAQGYGEVPVYRPLRVGVITTGDELVPVGQPRADHQIYDVNGPMLAALLHTIGVQVTGIKHARDTVDSLKKAFHDLLPGCDLILTVGGVSVGEKDLVKPVLASMGAELELWRVAMKPGKPVALAHLGKTPVVCLPGNPVSAFVVYTLLVTPLIRTLQGRSHIFPAIGYGQLATDTTFLEKREEFLRVQVKMAEGTPPQLLPYALQGSHIIRSLDHAGALARIPIHTRRGNGDPVTYYDLHTWLR